MKNIFILLLAVIVISGCSQSTGITLLDAKDFTKRVGDKEISLYTLESGNGVYLQVTSFGGRVVSLWTPDKNGQYQDIVLGYEHIDRYLQAEGERFLGPIVGRFANRIANGMFVLDSITYQVPINNNGQSLHGGLKGLDMVIWDVNKISKNEIELSYFSPDLEEGYPGNVLFTVNYRLTELNEFIISYKAQTDKPTVVNLSHHGLFNLKGEGNGTITDHILTINADCITPVNDVLIPTGEYMNVENSAFDFRKPTTIGKRINQRDVQLANGSGYDHNWVVSKTMPDSIQWMATVYEPHCGRVMEVWSDQPGIQFYSGNFFTGKALGKYGKYLNYREGIALETQKFPDSPNQPNFPCSRLNPGETYYHTCIYKFSVR